MDLSIYDVIKGPVVSEKAQKLNVDSQKLVLNVHPSANKPMIKEAIEKLFNVKVDNVRVIVRKGKRRFVNRRREIFGNLQKKAIITLKAGYELSMMDNIETKEQ